MRRAALGDDSGGVLCARRETLPSDVVKYASAAWSPGALRTPAMPFAHALAAFTATIVERER
jgi:hypothetical protein